MPPFPRLVKEVSLAIVGELTDRQSPFSRKASIAGGFVASGLRFAAGISIHALGPRPQKPMILWELEACPYSRTVREALSQLDLDAEIRPCPKGGTRFRPQLDGGTTPRLEDPNAGVVLKDSREIVMHLHQRYGVGKAPRALNLTAVTVITGSVFRLLTANRGSRARPSRAPQAQLELWSFEASPYCRRVREVLSELELPYTLHNVAKDSPRRPAFVARSGRMQVPWLSDPNTGTELFESLAIERYLEATYGAS